MDEGYYWVWYCGLRNVAYFGGEGQWYVTGEEEPLQAGDFDMLPEEKDKLTPPEEFNSTEE